MKDDETRALVERAKAGDRAAFESLALRYRERLLSVIQPRLGRALQSRLSPEDVLQETLLRAFRSIARFEWLDDLGSPFFLWLSGIAVRVILEAASRQRNETPLELDFEVLAKDVSPGRALARRERLERFEAALSGLSPDHQTVLKLVRLEGLSVNDAARRMNRSPNAVSHLLLRALRKLREAFGETHSFSLPPEGRLGEEAPRKGGAP